MHRQNRRELVLPIVLTHNFDLRILLVPGNRSQSPNLFPYSSRILSRCRKSTCESRSATATVWPLAHHCYTFVGQGQPVWSAFLPTLKMSQRFSSSTAFHLFADDMQGTGGGKPARVNDVATKLGVCLLAISNSCAAKRLQLNTKKSEVTWFGSATNLANFHRLIYTSKSDLTMYAALDWFASYFGDRTQQVITGHLSVNSWWAHHRDQFLVRSALTPTLMSETLMSERFVRRLWIRHHVWSLTAQSQNY